MTELQRKELELLRELIRICDDLGLRYYLVCGSALGAVKYKGFIPWDDDVDVAMTRADYEVFCDRAQRMLPKHIFLQNHKTEAGYPRIYTKLRDSKTTYIEKTTAQIRMNHGIFIDVFPLDGYPADPKDAKVLERKKKFLKLQVECVFDVDYGFLRNSFFALERVLGYHKRTDKTIDKLVSVLSRWSAEESEIWCNHGNWQGGLEYAPCEQYGEGVWAEFEGLKVRIPEGYDEYLTQKYGDWRAEPPVEEQIGHHYYSVCDVNIPYTEYIKGDMS